MPARYLVGDVFAVLATLEPNSVDLVFSSPPFLALRSYLPVDHPDKAKEIGSEPTPAAFIDTLLDVVEACARVLAPHGSLCFELGDTYSGTNQSGWDRLGKRALQHERGPNYRKIGTVSTNGAVRGAGWPQDKSLALIPQSFAWALAYGRNPFNGRETDPWRVRNIVRWCRPNPPVGALGDKFRPATSEIVVACKARDRYFDLDAVRVPADPANKRPSVLKREGIPGRVDQVMNPLGEDGQRIISNPAGAPPLDYWEIPTHPYPGSHYATFPPALVVRPVKAMCPEKVCRTCGEPSRRIVEASYVDANGKPAPKGEWKSGVSEGKGAHSLKTEVRTRTTTTTGWSDCGHDDFRPGVVLDLFAGSGTTLAVATGHGRDAIGIDLDHRNADLARERVGMFLTVEQHALIEEAG